MFKKYLAIAVMLIFLCSCAETISFIDYLLEPDVVHYGTVEHVQCGGPAGGFVYFKDGMSYWVRNPCAATPGFNERVIRVSDGGLEID